MDVGPGMASAMPQLTLLGHVFSNLTEDPAHFNLFQTLFARQSKNTVALPVPGPLSFTLVGSSLHRI